MDMISEFGKAVRKSREEKHFSQQLLAEKCNLSIRQLHEIEKGDANPRLTTVVNISKVLDISIDSFKNWED